MRAIMLAIVCLLCAYSAVGEDGDSAFCDTIDGAIAEFGDKRYYRTANTERKTLGTGGEVAGVNYTVYRAINPTKLPGATSCVAHVFAKHTTVYTCKWTPKDPRSTFVSMGSSVASCLGQRGYSSKRIGNNDGPVVPGVKTSDNGRQFRLTMPKGDGSTVRLIAHKVAAKGTFLQMIFRADDTFDSLREQVDDWAFEHELWGYCKSTKNERVCRREEYSDNNPFDTSAEFQRRAEETALLWDKAFALPQ